MPNSPSPPGATTISTSPEYRRFSCVTISKWSVAILRLLLHLLADFHGFIDGADHVERLLWQIVVLAFQDFAEAAHGLAQRHVATFAAGELRRREERLREEALDLASPAHQQLVVFRELFHAQNGDDVL